MRPGGGKAKGADFERLVCNQLSQWVTGGKRKDIFWRSAMSGGRATVGRKKGELNQTQEGDISAVDPAGHWLVKRFVIECKCVKSLDLDAFIYYHKGALAGFWNTLTKITSGTPKEPMLIAKQNQYPPMLITSSQGAGLLVDGQPLRALFLTDARVGGSWGRIGCVAYDYASLLESVSYRPVG
jgi:hypothetical protein